jgi:hypothetical protein
MLLKNTDYIIGKSDVVEAAIWNLKPPSDI